jgi:hypothetical protein
VNEPRYDARSAVAATKKRGDEPGFCFYARPSLSVVICDPLRNRLFEYRASLPNFLAPRIPTLNGYDTKR